MTSVIDYKIVNKESKEGSLSRLWKSITFSKLSYIYIIQLTMGTSSGFTPGNLLILDDYSKVVVLESDGIVVLVKTIKDSKEIKPIKGVLSILTQKWGGQI